MLRKHCFICRLLRQFVPVCNMQIAIAGSDAFGVVYMNLDYLEVRYHAV